MNKMTMRIIDNIQLHVKSIHVRFEDTIKKSFSFGFCLNSLNINTVD